MEKVVYANAYTVSCNNLEVLIDFKMLTPENRDPNKPETITVRVVQNIQSAKAFRDLLSQSLLKIEKKGEGDLPPNRL